MENGSACQPGVATPGCSKFALSGREREQRWSGDLRHPRNHAAPLHPGGCRRSSVVARRSIARERARHAPSFFVFHPTSKRDPAERFRTRTARRRPGTEALQTRMETLRPEAEALGMRTEALRSGTAGSGRGRSRSVPGWRLSGRGRSCFVPGWRHSGRGRSHYGRGWSRSVSGRRHSGRGPRRSVLGRRAPDVDGAAPSRDGGAPDVDGVAPSRDGGAPAGQAFYRGSRPRRSSNSAAAPSIAAISVSTGRKSMPRTQTRSTGSGLSFLAGSG